jgi:SAM-dependent methyltransferase
MSCNLCRSNDVRCVATKGKRSFYHCTQCQLVSVPVSQHLSMLEEKKRYAYHENFADNLDYVRYLTEISHEIERIPVKRPSILDFGSGQEYVLTRIFREKGFYCAPYDPLYNVGLDNLAVKYDIVVLCETIEHLRDLPEEIKLINRLCKHEGYVLIRTRFYSDKNSMATWFYALDETHVNFFNDGSLEYVAGMLERKVIYSDHERTVIIGL